MCRYDSSRRVLEGETERRLRFTLIFVRERNTRRRPRLLRRFTGELRNVAILDSSSSSLPFDLGIDLVSHTRRIIVVFLPPPIQLRLFSTADSKVKQACFLHGLACILSFSI
ncbi:hypothetical protein Bca4012_006444 [Brassica carinata]